ASAHDGLRGPCAVETQEVVAIGTGYPLHGPRPSDVALQAPSRRPFGLALDVVGGAGGVEAFSSSAGAPSFAASTASPACFAANSSSSCLVSTRSAEARKIPLRRIFRSSWACLYAARSRS